MTTTSVPEPRLCATTGDDYNQDRTGIDQTARNSSKYHKLRDSDTENFRTLSWSADGTSLITSNADQTVHTFILPPNLLEPASSDAPDQSDTDHSTPHHITPYSTHKHPTQIYATEASPYYSISSPETTLILTSSCSLPIRLISPFAPGILATYPLVNLSTEKWIAPHSLLFSVDSATAAQDTADGYAAGTSLRFLAGSKNQISVFDISRPGSGPMTNLATAPGNRKLRRGSGGMGMAGIVSAMAVSSDGILAAGTFSRGVGLYDSQGMGDTIGTWSLSGVEDGDGVTSLQWSRCGRYLVVAERSSDGLGVWDVRGTGRRLAWLAGRNAKTLQRLGFALGGSAELDGGEDVYAGGVDGCVRVWNRLGMKEGELSCDWQWQAHDDVVSVVGVHACGTVVATCSGSRHAKNIERDDVDGNSGASQSGSDSDNSSDDEEQTQDNSIKVWSLR